MSKKQEAATQQQVDRDPKSGVPICQYCGHNMRWNGASFGVIYYQCKQPDCGKGNIKLPGRQKAPAYDNEGFSARP